MSENESPCTTDQIEVDPPKPSGKDMRGWCVAFGLAQLGGASLFLLMAACMLLVAGMGSSLPTPKGAPPLQLSQILSSVALSLAGAVLWIVLGLGSIFPRRWARSVTISLSWIWLAIGFSTVAILVCNGVPPPPPGQAPMTPAVKAIASFTAVAFAGFFMAFLPGLLIAFYQHPRVRETFETRDPFARWTDACPSSVLTASFFAAFGVVGMLPLLAHNCVFPVFGYFLSGAAGGVAIVLYTGVVVWVARGLYRLDPCAWKTAMAMVFFGAASAAVTMTCADQTQMYKLMGLSSLEIEQIAKSPVVSSMKWMWLSWVVQAGYLVYLRRFFRRAPGDGSGGCCSPSDPA